MTQHRTDN